MKTKRLSLEIYYVWKYFANDSTSENGPKTLNAVIIDTLYYKREHQTLNLSMRKPYLNKLKQFIFRYHYTSHW